ncbi:methionine--tRNA ligase, partial [Candidatus Bathyarchaeota archaeon]
MSGIVTIEEFKKLDMRVGTVVEVERIPGSKSLY